MKYNAVTGVWEITMGCNMRCKHCGSICMEPLPDELTTEEALRVCDEIGELGLKWITLSGGEPLTRRDWHILAKRLKDNNVIPNIITNAWILNEETLDKAIESGVGTFAISLDGLKETHDFIRREGSYDRIMNALDLMKEKGITTGIITTLTNRNINQLEELYQILLDKGVRIWQLQIGLPMGTLAENKDMLLTPEQIDDVIDFIHSTIKEPRLNVYPADCLGYYNIKEVEARTKANKSQGLVMWKGCNAGKRSLGILHNGDILGCTSIRDREYIEGNIRKTPLREIWENENNFSWNRKLKKESLSGMCQKCMYGETCLGGCPNTRLTMNGDINSENAYCSYNVAMKDNVKKLQSTNDVNALMELAKKFTLESELQLTQLVLERVLELELNNAEALDYYGYTSYMLGNYNDSLAANKRALDINPSSIYANKGYGLCLCKLGEVDNGLEYLKKSAKLTNKTYMDPYHDLILTLTENGRRAEALEVFKEAEAKCSGFIQSNQKLYSALVI